MKKSLLLLLCLAGLKGFAQEMPYTLSVLNEPYVELSEATSVVGDETWDDPDAVLPLGFIFQLMDEVITDIYLTPPGSQIASYIKKDSVNFLQPYLSDIMDAGYDTASLSPLLFATEGMPGERIFKMEWRDVAFYAEWEESGTVDNRISFQMWLYEGSNIIEYRYGNNTVTQGTLVHFAGAPLIGIGTNADATGNGGWESFWLLHGDVADPQVYNLTSQMELPPILEAEPPSGTVYRFTPTFVNIGESKPLLNAKIYPTLVNDQLSVMWTDDLTSIGVYDLSGKLILQENIKRGLNTFDVSSLATGQYVVRINHENEVIHQKITKL